MQFRIECYEHELPMILNNLKSIFDVKSVSKYYPNVRQTSVESYCEGRVYVKINGLEKDRHNKLIEYMVTDMLQFLSKITQNRNIKNNPEQCGFHLKATSAYFCFFCIDTIQNTEKLS